LKEESCFAKVEILRTLGKEIRKIEGFSSFDDSDMH